MLNKLFPYKLQLQIFQLDEYSSSKFLRWLSSHFLIRTIENKKQLVWTQKAKSIYYLAILLSILVIILGIIFYKLLGFIIAFVFSTQAYIFILIAYFLLLPYETYQKNKIKRETQTKLGSFPKLKIIGITGSYGKTSVKEFLYQIISTKHTVLKTPESYNTPYGIAKVVDLELDDSYEYFICEMGAYRVGEIKEICDMVHPRYGILTGINEQHLETFGSLKNTTKTKFELIDSLPEDGFGIVNIANKRVKEEYPEHNKNENIYSYGEASRTFEFHLNVNDYGTFFTLPLKFRDKDNNIKTKIFPKVRTLLLGKANIENITTAATMASLLGMEPDLIIKAIDKLEPIPHRIEFKPQKEMIIIDDAYNSNVDGFKNAIEVLIMYDPLSFTRTKILVTPGIVDLGKETVRIHKELGKEISKIERINYIILVGKSERTRGLKEGIGIENKKKIIEVDSIGKVWEKIKELNVKNPVVLLENDLPDNY